MNVQQDDDLLAAAARAFESDGWRRLTVERVAVEAGLPPADVIRKYPSREHLAVAMFSQVVERLPDEFADEIETGLPLTDKLYFLLAHELRSLEPRKDFVRRALLDLFNPLSPTALLQTPLVQRYTALTADLIRHSRARGEISRLTLPWAASWGFWLLRAQVIAYWLADNSDRSERTHAQADAWVDLFVRSLESVAGPAGGLFDRLTDSARSRRRRAVSGLEVATGGDDILGGPVAPTAATGRARRARQAGAAAPSPPAGVAAPPPLGS